MSEISIGGWILIEKFSSDALANREFRMAVDDRFDYKIDFEGLNTVTVDS